ncbi:MAG: phosphate signaling complex protein PhoU [Chloroflexi bacterium]|nr:phosphate signaling complex protein PhoU [Chloroflexota bacterium]
MLRVAFHAELNRLQADVAQLGMMVKTAIRKAVVALQDRNLDAAREVLADDQLINDKRFRLEHDILVLIATQQPLASDLRNLAAMLEIITELERMGDYGKGISKINLMLGQQYLIKPLVDIPKMADIALDMLASSLEAFAALDVEAAKRIPLMDDQVDELYNQVYRDLIERVIKNPDHMEQANMLMWVAHNLERAGDRAVNICERIIFVVEGRMTEFDAGHAAQPPSGSN